VHRRAGENFTEYFDAFQHFLAELLFDDALHGLGHELQIALIGDLELDLVPNVGEQRPGIVPDHRLEHFRVRELNDTSTRVIAGDVLPAEFPKCRIEIADIDYVAGGVAHFDAVADAIWPAN